MFAYMQTTYSYMLWLFNWNAHIDVVRQAFFSSENGGRNEKFRRFESGLPLIYLGKSIFSFPREIF